MRSIMVLNAKGGSGKTTVATNLAAYYASQGVKVALADHDPQQSSSEWLAQRPKNRPPIVSIDATKPGAKAPRGVEVLIRDVPASVHGSQLTQLVRKAETIIVPVMPSPIDMRACKKFLKELRETPTVKGRKAKIAVVANRAHGNTLVFLDLDDFLEGLRGVKYVTALRESTNYINAATRGIGIHELAQGQTKIDRAEWDPLIEWLESKQSRV